MILTPMLKICTFIAAVVMIAAMIIVSKYKRLSIKKTRIFKTIFNMVILIIIVIILPIGLLITINQFNQQKYMENQQRYKEWNSQKDIIMENHPEIISANINIERNPWISINLYVSDSFEFDNAETVFQDFLINFSDNFVEELERIKSPNTIKSISIEFILYPSEKGTIMYEFKADRTNNYMEWFVDKSIDKRFLNKRYYLSDYQPTN